MGKYFGTDGIRGKAETFTEEFLEKIVRGLDVRGKRVFIAGDTRESTEVILKNLERSLKNNGAKEIGSAGVFPTPGINNVFYNLVYDYAIDVTASHNPYTDNGIKIFEYGENSGVKLGEDGRNRIEAELENELPAEFESFEAETIVINETSRAKDYYKKHLREYLKEADFSGLRIILDYANGATSVISGEVFEELGASVTVINNDRNFGRKINDKVGSTHIEGLQKQVHDGEFDLGAAFDGDGDRCMLVDEKGGVVDGDEILAILGKFFGLKALVGTVMANQGLLNWGKENGVEVLTTDVGDQNVAKEMRKKNIKLGGEQSGHIILPGEAMGDGMLTALVVAKVLAETKKPLSELAAEMKKLPQVMMNVSATKAQKELLKSSGEIKELINQGRLLVRPSGTEELVRITLWGEDQEKIDELGKELAEKLTEEFEHGRN